VRRISFGALASCALSVSACSHTEDFTALSTKNVHLAELRIDAKDSKGLVRGEDCKYIIVVIPTRVPNPKQAVDQALQSNNTQLLLNALLTYEWFLYSIHLWAKLLDSRGGFI
jgi:hypothetical protein